jgi:hypothetical protein
VAGELTSSNIVAVEEWPERELVGPHLTNLASYREAFSGVLTKLVRPYPPSIRVCADEKDKLLGKLSMLIDQSERIYFEAHSKQPSEFFDEPLWYTWTIIHFSISPSLSSLLFKLGGGSWRIVNSLPPLLHTHISHLNLLTDLSKTILSLQTSFDDSKLALERWLALSRAGERWEEVREWEELVDLELIAYGEEESEEEEIKPKRKGKGKK